MADQSDTLVSSQLFICLELVLLVANILTLVDLTASSSHNLGWLAGYRAKCRNSLTWLAKRCHMIKYCPLIGQEIVLFR